MTADLRAAILMLVCTAPWSGCRLLEDDRTGELRALGNAACAVRDPSVTSLGLVRDGRRLAVPVGPGLVEAIAQRDVWFDSACTVDLREGDLPEPFGDGMATHHLVLSSDRGAELALRVRAGQDSALPRVLGYCALAACLLEADPD